MSKRLLPIGIHTFEKIREKNLIYVDKTEMIHSLLTKGEVYFLSRPRRFGKSLLLDTIHQLVKGRKELFSGLWIEDKWDWSQKYPVVRIDFGAGVLHSQADLEKRINVILKKIAKEYDISLREDTIRDRFFALLNDLEEKYDQKVVVLVDEYDKPILDNFTNREISEVMRQGLRDLYSVLKAQQESLRFVLLTGVSKFAKVSVFSGLNNLEDISLSSSYGNICGYTQVDLEECFVEWLDGVDLEMVKQWYNGYNFLGDPVYNPFDVLLYLKNRKFKNYWFETGTPDFLVELMKEQQYSLPQLESFYSTDDLMNKFDADHLIIEGFFFQTGYLTIKEEFVLPTGMPQYRLGFPNLEVQYSLSLLFMSTCSPRRFEFHLQQELTKAIIAGQPERFEAPLKQFFSSIPFDWFKFSGMEKYEGYWASLIYSMLAMLGVHLKAEDTTNQGQLDLVLYYDRHYYLIEFKMSSNSQDPIQQIKNKNYAQKYSQAGREIWAVGITFDKEAMNISKFQTERLV